MHREEFEFGYQNKSPTVGPAAQTFSAPSVVKGSLYLQLVFLEFQAYRYDKGDYVWRSACVPHAIQRSMGPSRFPSSDPGFRW